MSSKEILQSSNNNLKNKTIKFFDIPLEIREMIYIYFKKIKNMKYQLIVRSVCKEWNDLFTDINDYDENNNIKLTHKLYDNKFKTFFSNGSLKCKMLFESYSKFIFVEYNNKRKLIKIMENFPPYEIIMHEYIDGRIQTKKINVLTNQNSIELSEKYKCMNVLNPIIDDEDMNFHNPQFNNYHPNLFLELNNAPPPCTIA